MMEYNSKEEIWSLDSVQDQIKLVLKDVGQMLIEKNRKYGNSALCPKRIFSKSDPCDAIRVRIDDKLSRIANHQDDENEDPEWDIMGYLVLLRVCKNLKMIEQAFDSKE